MIGLFLHRRRQAPHFGWLTLPLAGIMGAAVIQTGSRGGLFCIAAGLMAMPFTGANHAAVVRNRLLGLVAIAALGYGAFLSPVMRERFEEATNEGNSRVASGSIRP